MLILLTNDDGVHAPGLRALERQLQSWGDVCVVAPSVEQSGVGHSVTFLAPLVAKEVYDGPRLRAWAVEGSPADCVKLGLFEFCPRKPDLVVSGMNLGLNAGINVLYSGTVAAAIEGAFFGITSIAVSLEDDPQVDYDAAAQKACSVIEQILDLKSAKPQLFNINVPSKAVRGPAELHIVPMSTVRYGEDYEKRTDPRGRPYFWSTTDPPPPAGSGEDDLSALELGHITVTPLHFDLTQVELLKTMQTWPIRQKVF